MNSYPNSALIQNWVGCTVRPPRTKVARTLRAQCPGRGRCCAHSKQVARMSRAQPAQVARMLGVHWSRHAQAACPQVATSFRCRDTKAARIMSRHQIGVTTSFLLPSPSQVATSRPGRDLPGDEPMSRHQFHVETSFLPTVGFPGRDTKIPGRDLPHSRPCRDIKSMSRRRFCPRKAYQVATPLPVATSACRDLQTRSRPSAGNWQ